jgi:acetyl-CoA carboxylase biotin carboxyl carrier protein
MQPRHLHPALARLRPAAPARPQLLAAPARGRSRRQLPLATTALKAPMIGTFYRSSGPDSRPSCNVGDMVEKGQVICIIEAMKLFNEIEAEQSGRIVKALVENASPVEYDQPCS